MSIEDWGLEFREEVRPRWIRETCFMRSTSRRETVACKRHVLRKAIVSVHRDCSAADGDASRILD